MEGNRKLGTLALLLAAIGVGASATLNKLAMNVGLTPVWLNVLRLGFSVLVMLPFFLGSAESKRQVRQISRKNLRLSVLAGVMLAIHFLAWASSLKYADSVVAVSIWSTYSLMTVIGSTFLLKEKTPLAAVLGIALATVGVFVCAIGAGQSQLVGLLWALLAAVSQAAYTLCGRTVRREVSVMPYTMIVYSVAFACQLAAGVLSGLPEGGITWPGIYTSLLLAFVCTLGGHSTQNYALKFFKAPVVSAVVITEVFTGPLLVYAVFGEAPGLNSVIGGVIILLGVGLVMLRELHGGKGAGQPIPQPVEE